MKKEQQQEQKSKPQEEDVQIATNDDTADGYAYVEETDTEEMDEPEYEEDEDGSLAFTKEEVIRVLETLCVTKQVSLILLKELLNTPSKAKAMLEFLQQNDLLQAMIETGKWEVDVEDIKRLLKETESTDNSHNNSLEQEQTSSSEENNQSHITSAESYPESSGIKSSTKWIIAGVVLFVNFIFSVIVVDVIFDSWSQLFPVILGCFPLILTSIACFIIGFLKMGNNK